MNAFPGRFIYTIRVKPLHPMPAPKQLVIINRRTNRQVCTMEIDVLDDESVGCLYYLKMTENNSIVTDNIFISNEQMDEYGFNNTREY